MFLLLMKFDELLMYRFNSWTLIMIIWFRRFILYFDKGKQNSKLFLKIEVLLTSHN